MEIFGGLFGKKRREDESMTREQAMEKIVDFGRSKIPPAAELSYHFVCSGNPSLIRAYHELFRVGAAAYGGSAAHYSAEGSRLSARQAEAEAASLPFGGQRSMGTTVENVANVSDVLSEMSSAAYGALHISYVSVGPKGREWVPNVYDTLLGEAVRQGILPFRMYATNDKRAAQFLLDSFSLISGS
jgi:hypothetical protein